MHAAWGETMTVRDRVAGDVSGSDESGDESGRDGGRRTGARRGAVGGSAHERCPTRVLRPGSGPACPSASSARRSSAMACAMYSVLLEVQLYAPGERDRVDCSILRVYCIQTGYTAVAAVIYITHRPHVSIFRLTLVLQRLCTRSAQPSPGSCELRPPPAANELCGLAGGLLHTQLNKDCSLWSPRAQQTHSERSRWSR